MALSVALSGRDVSEPFAIALALGLLGLTFWQVFGGWAYAGRQIVDRNAERAWLSYAAMGCGVCLHVGLITSLFLPDPPLDVTPIDQRLRIVREGAVATVQGQIDYRTLTALKQTHAEQPLQSVRFDSRGGQTIAGRSIGLWIMENKLDTHVASICLSACTLGFAGGHRRSAAPLARFGFHAARYVAHSQVRVVDLSEVAAQNRAFLMLRGVAGAFVDHIEATPPDALWEPTHAELRAVGFLTD